MGQLLMELRDLHLKKAKVIPVSVDDDRSKEENDCEEESEEVGEPNADVEACLSVGRRGLR